MKKLEPTSSMLISLDTAAAQLGYSESGLRKLIRKKAIQFFQVSPHTAIKFKQEWLDEFVESKSIKPSRPLLPQPKPTKARPPMKPRFDPALLDL